MTSGILFNVEEAISFGILYYFKLGAVGIVCFNTFIAIIKSMNALWVHKVGSVGLARPGRQNVHPRVSHHHRLLELGRQLPVLKGTSRFSKSVKS